MGNERGEVITSVLTESESIEGLQMMADGLMKRYEVGEQQPPHLLYTDHDCCSSKFQVNIWGMHYRLYIPSAQLQNKMQALFSKWEGLKVRLDVWYFMRLHTSIYCG